MKLPLERRWLLLPLLIMNLSLIKCQLRPPEQCLKSELDKVTSDIRIISSSMPSDFIVANPLSDMILNVGSAVRGSNRLEHKCDLMRQVLSRLLKYSSPCYMGNLVKIEKELEMALMFLRKYCNDAYHWTRMSCYSSSQIRTCESSFTPGASVNLANAAVECTHYENFFSCAKKAIDSNCPNKDQTHYPVYFLDKAMDQAWKCGSDPGQLYPSEAIDRMSGPSRQDSSQPNYPNYASHTGGYGPMYPSYNSVPHMPPAFMAGSPNQQGWQGQGNQISNYNPPQIASTSLGYPNVGHQHGLTGPEMSAQDPIMSVRPGPYGDHQFSLFPAENCIERTSYYARGCEENLIQRQREGRNARTGPEVQRRICCSLFFYHDCLSKTVIQYCRDASPTTVDIMMGQRKRELAITCRDHSREHCNSANNLSSSSLFAFLMLLIWTFVFH